MKFLIKALAASIMGTMLLSSTAFAADYDDALQFSWDGTNFQESTVESFVGSSVIAPGSAKERTLTVRNDGPTKGVLKASVINVELLTPNAVDEHHNPDHVSPGAGYGGAGNQGNFYDDLKLVWASTSGDGEMSFTEADSMGVVPVSEIVLEPGQSTTVTIGYDFPENSLSGNKANVEPRQATFDVYFTINGDLADLGGGDDDNNGGGNNGGDSGMNLPKTGGPAFWLIIAGAGLVGAGIGVLFKARQR